MSIQLFNFENNLIRVININGEPWFVTVDVFDALNIVWKGQDKLKNIKPEWKRQCSEFELPLDGSVQIPINAWTINKRSGE